MPFIDHSFLSISMIAGAPQAGSASEHSVAVFIAEIAVMLFVGRLLGELMQRIGQPAVMGQLIAGILIGPSVLGAIWPSAHAALFPDVPEQKKMIDAVSQLGILMLLLLTGIETDLALVNRMRRTAFFTSISGIVLPFACGFLLGHFLPAAMLPDPSKRLVTSLFLATALSISSVKIVAMVIMEVGFLRRNVGQIILSSAILDDTIGWVIIAVIGGLAGQGTVNLKGLGSTVLGTIAFLALSFTVGRRVIAYIIRWTNDHMRIEMPVVTAMLVLMCIMALITDYIGVHTVLGAFVIGILIGQAPILTEHIEEQLRGLIVALFAPVFFSVAGLSIDLSILKSLYLVKLALVLIVIASVGKLVGCYIGGRLGRMNHRESIALALGMNARGSTEVIVATIGLSMGALTQDIFTLIVVMAISTTMITPPLLRWALSRIPVSGEEKERLDREEAEAREFVPSVDRLLIAVDNSRNGMLASQLAGLFVGTRQVLATVLNLDETAHARETGALDPPDQAVQASIEVASSNTQENSRPADTTSVLINRTDWDKATEAILEESRKGYEMLFLGVDYPLIDGAGPEQSDGFSLLKVAEDFKGVIGLVVAGGDGKAEKQAGKLRRILAPTSGTDYSKRASEVAIAIARGCKGTLSALHILPPTNETALMRHPGTLIDTGRALVKDIEKIGRREGVNVKPEIRFSRSPEEAIIDQVEKGRYDLVVVGAKLRTGDQLFFGHSMSVLLDKRPCSILVVIS